MHLQELQSKGKVQLGNSKSGRGRLQEWSLKRAFITQLRSQFKWGFTKVAVTRAGHLQEWSQGELRLYCTFRNFIQFIIKRERHYKTNLIQIKAALNLNN